MAARDGDYSGRAGIFIVMKYQHVVFDIDGTLTDTYLPVTKALIDTVYCLTGKRYQMEEILFAFGIPGEISLKRLGVQDSKAGLQMWNTLLEKKYSHEIVLFEGVTKMLASLADAGVALGIITSKTWEEYVASFAAIYPSEAQYFQTVITIDDTLKGKPDPAPMKEYLRRTRVLAGKVLFIGDTVYDCQCGLGAGVDFGLALWGSQEPETVEMATYRFQTPADVVKVACGSKSMGN